MASWKDTIKNDSEQPKKSSWKDTIIDESNSDEWKSREPEVSTLESLGRGALQSGTYGFADEIGSGIVSALTTDPTLPNYLERLKMNYETAREDTRGANKTAEEANPNAYLTGEIGAGVATGLMTGGAGAIANLGKVGLKQGWKQLGTQGLTQGAAAGLGSTEADLLKGEIGQASRDTAMGAGLGAGLGVALPASLNVVGKATSTVGKNIVGKSKALEDLVDTFNLAKGGKSVVGKEAEEAIFKDVEKISKDIVKGGTEQVKQSSKEMGNILKTIEKSDDARQIISYLKDNIDNKNILPDDKARLKNLAEQYEDRMIKETVESSKDLTRKALDKTMRIEQESAPMIGEKISFPDIKETPDALLALRKKIDQEGLETVSILNQPIIPDKITTEVITKVKDMDGQEAYNIYKSLRDLERSGKLEETGGNAAKEYMNLIGEFISEKLGTTKNAAFNESKNTMRDAFQARNILPSLDDTGKMGADTDLRVQKLLLSGSNTTPLDLKRAFGYLDDKFVSPELKEEALGIAKRARFNKEAERSSLLNPLVPVIPIPSGKAMGIRGAEAFGTISGSNFVKSTKDFTRKMINLDDATLSKLVTKVNPEFGTTLQKALQDASKKDRLLWSLSQQPAFRQAVEKAEREENTIELPTLDVNTDN